MFAPLWACTGKDRHFRPNSAGCLPSAYPRPGCHAEAPMPKLTKRFVDAQKRPPEGKELYLWDSEVRGFGYRLKANGTGAWIFQYRKAGASRRMTFGSYPGDEAMTPEEARAEAETLRGQARKGDPAREQSAKAAKG